MCSKWAMLTFFPYVTIHQLWICCTMLPWIRGLKNRAFIRYMKNEHFFNLSQWGATDWRWLCAVWWLRRIGEFGPWQRAIYILSCVFVLIPSGLHTAGVSFITGTPKFQRAAPDVEREVNKCCKNCTKYAFIGPYAYNSTVTEVYFFNLLSLCLATVEKI